MSRLLLIMPDSRSKQAVKAFLISEHPEILDLGTHNTDPVDCSDYAEER